MTSVAYSTPAKSNPVGFVTPSPTRGLEPTISPESGKSKLISPIYFQQKETISSLTKQVETYRQRELRHAQEIQTMEKLLSEEDRDAVRKNLMNQSSWEQQRKEFQFNFQQLEQEKEDLVHQISQAKQSINKFHQVFNDMELKIQQREHELSTEITTLKVTISQKDDEIRQLQAQSKIPETQFHAIKAELENEKHDRQTQERQLNEQLKKLTEEIRVYEDNTEKQSTRIRGLQEQLGESEAAYTQKLQELSTQLKTAEGKLLTHETHATEADRSVSTIQLSLEEAQCRELRLSAEKQELLDQLEQTKKKLSDAVVGQKTKDELISLLKSELNKAKDTLSSKQNESVMTTLKSELNYLRDNFQSQYASERELLQRRTELVELSAKEAQSEIEKQHEKILSLQTQIRDHELENEMLKKQQDRLKAQIDERDQSIANLQRQLQDLQHGRDSLSGTLATGFKELLLESESQKLKVKVEQLTTDNHSLKLRSEIAEHKIKEIAELKTTLAEERHLVNRLKDDLQSLRVELKEKEKDLSTMEQQKHAAEQSSVGMDYLNAAYKQLQEDLKSLQQLHDTQLQEKEILRTENVRHKQELTHLQDEKQDLHHQLKEAAEKSLFLEKELMALQESYSKQTSAINDLNRELETIKQERKSSELALKTQSTDKQSQIDRLHKQLEEATRAQANALQEEFYTLRMRIHEVRDRNRRLDEKMTTMNNQHTADQQNLQKLKVELQDLRQSNEHKQQHIEKLDNLLNEFKENEKKIREEFHQFKLSAHYDQYNRQFQHYKNLLQEKNAVMQSMEHEIQALVDEKKHAQAQSQQVIDARHEREQQLQTELEEKDKGIKKLKHAIKSLQKAKQAQEEHHQRTLHELTYQVNSQKRLVEAFKAQVAAPTPPLPRKTRAPSTTLSQVVDNMSAADAEKETLDLLNTSLEMENILERMGHLTDAETLDTRATKIQRVAE